MTTTTEVLQSLTGWDEIAIEQACGKPIEVIAAQGRDLQFTRILAAVLISRREEDTSLKDAYQRVMGQQIETVQHEFEDEPDDVFPDAPDSEAGKDSSEPEPTPEASPPSA